MGTGRIWITDKRIKDAQMELIRAGFPTKISILAPRKFVMVISLKKLKKTIEETIGTRYKYLIRDASKGQKTAMEIILIGDFSNLQVEQYKNLLTRFKQAGFDVDLTISEDMKRLTLHIDLAPIKEVFTARGISSKYFTVSLKVKNNEPFLTFLFGR